MFFTKDCFLFKKGESYLFTALKTRQNYLSLHGTVKGFRFRSNLPLSVCSPKNHSRTNSAHTTKNHPVGQLTGFFWSL
jgi:hypothetical protein